MLNPNAATLATYLVADLEGNFAQAAEIGLRGLDRAPSHMVLINNTAYSLALAGRPEQAKKLLERLDGSAMPARGGRRDTRADRHTDGTHRPRTCKSAAIVVHGI